MIYLLTLYVLICGAQTGFNIFIHLREAGRRREATERSFKQEKEFHAENKKMAEAVARLEAKFQMTAKTHDRGTG